MNTRVDVVAPMAETRPATTTLKKTARLACVAYVGLAIFGLLGIVVIRNRLYVSSDAVATAAKLAGHHTLARFGIAADLMTVVTQSLAALYFFKLFRKVDAFAAGSIATFGFMNSGRVTCLDRSAGF